MGKSGVMPEPWAEMRELFLKVASGKDLTIQEAQAAMDAIIDGKATCTQLGAFAAALSMKGEAITEIVGCALKMQERVAPLDLKKEGLVDVIGTTRGGTDTFSISTAAALVAAAAGVKLAKQAVRGANGRHASAETLIALGVNVDVGVNTLQRCLNEVGICFIDMLAYNDILKRLHGPLRELGSRTIFDLLGPISNPARVKRQVIGVTSEKQTEVVSLVLKKLGMQHAMVVYGLDGLGNITTSGKTKVCELAAGQIQNYYLSPEQFGIAKSPLTALKASSAEDSALMVNEVLNGRSGPARDVVVLNAGAVIRVGGFASSIEKAIEVARRSIDGGRAKAVMERLIKLTQL